MKIKQLVIACGLAVALLCTVGTASAQQGGGGGGGGFGGGGGGRGGRGGGGGNFDPAAMQQRMLDNIQQQLGITNDTDWSAIEPLVQKVIEARAAAQGPALNRMFGGGRGGRGGQGGQGGQPNNRRAGGMFGAATANPDADALQKALDDDAPSGQVKDLLTKYQNSQKVKRAALVTAQETLRQVLTSKQEAQATLLGLLE